MKYLRWSYILVTSSVMILSFSKHICIESWVVFIGFNIFGSSWLIVNSISMSWYRNLTAWETSLITIATSIRSSCHWYSTTSMVSESGNVSTSSEGRWFMGNSSEGRWFMGHSCEGRWFLCASTVTSLCGGAYQTTISRVNGRSFEAIRV